MESEKTSARLITTGYGGEDGIVGEVVIVTNTKEDTNRWKRSDGRRVLSTYSRDDIGPS